MNNIKKILSPNLINLSTGFTIGLFNFIMPDNTLFKILILVICIFILNNLFSLIYNIKQESFKFNFLNDLFIFFIGFISYIIGFIIGIIIFNLII